MKGRSINIGTYAQIPVKIHWTFGFLILFVLYTSYTNELDVKTSLFFLLYILILFFCVTLHEYGHALMARKYGVHTAEIILTPIGGIAQMGEMDNNPKHELWIALAGPLVNVVLAIILGIGIFLFLGAEFLPLQDDYSIFNNFPDMVRLVFILNIVLFVFNLIPAYPMDGGRVLRAIVGFWTDFDKATLIATTIGMILSLLFLAIAWYLTHPTLGLIGVFIFIAARNERKVAKKNMFLQTPIRPHIQKKYTKAYSQDNLSSLYELHNSGKEIHFLVFNNEDNHIGSIPSLFLLDAQRLEASDLLVEDYLRRHNDSVSPDISILDVARYMSAKGHYIMAVKENSEIIGVVTRELLNKL